MRDIPTNAEKARQIRRAAIWQMIMTIAACAAKAATASTFQTQKQKHAITKCALRKHATTAAI